MVAVASGPVLAMPANTQIVREEVPEEEPPAELEPEAELKLLEPLGQEFETPGPILGNPGVANTWPNSPSPTYTWQILPQSLLYRPYLASGREPRLSSVWVHEKDLGWLWESTFGGRVGLLRYGTEATGWQLDAEGAAFPRLDLEHDRDLVAVDYRAGMSLSRQWDSSSPFALKWLTMRVGYYHLSSHLGDEFIERVPSRGRINYVRDTITVGVSSWLHWFLRGYAEVGYAFYNDGDSKPWEFQFGFELSPGIPVGPSGSPFLAINGRIRQEVNFGGSLTVQTGWQWRGETGHLARIGVQYFNGKSDQYQFFNEHEEHIGLGLWYDF